MTLNEPKWWHIALYGALALTGGAGAFYCFKEAIRRDDIIKRLKKDRVMSLKDVQQLTEKWEEIVQKAQGSVTAGGKSKKVAPLNDMAMVGRLYSQFVMIDEKLGAKYLFEVGLDSKLAS